ncbi:MAG: hypothetical protein IMZ44_20115, partial [Planctomycetes bacterium]|nr:hypothetical protein [Planctomycetota bacterium]
YITTPSSVTYYVSGRGPLRTENILNSDLSFLWSRKLRGSVEVFVRALVNNVFNQQGVMSVDTTVSSNASPGSYTAASLPVFNPFVAAPVADVNYRYGPLFGQPTAPSNYQDSRSFSCSFGIRF